MFCSGMACAQVSLPDENLRDLLLNSNTTNQLVALNETGHYFAIDANSNGSIEQTEALAVYELRMEDAGIQSLEGIGSFSNLTKINAMFNQIATADFTGLTHLEELKLGSNSITSINLTGLTNLKILDLFLNQLTALYLSTLINLEVLDTFENTGLEEINF